MSRRKHPDAQRRDTNHAAPAAEREDPMTSFDPEADQAAFPGESGAATAAGPEQNNGSATSARAPGERPVDEPVAEPAVEPDGEQQAAAEEQAPEPAPGEEAAPAEEAPDALEQARQEAAENYDRFLRLQAEVENYKRRMAKEHTESLRYAISPLVTDVAAVIDNLERAIEHARKEQGETVEALVAGIEMVLKQLGETLGRYGVVRIEAVGKPFDPSRHEAINVVETNDVPENQVLDEYQAGYLLHERVIRPARVSVSKRGDGGQGAPGAG